MSEVKKKKRKLKKDLIYKLLFIFNLLLLLFLIIFYGIKIYKNYNEYHNSKFLSLKFDKGYYKDNDNNYIKYSGYMWRILKINDDKSIEIVMDDPYNYMIWNSKNSNYIDSDINAFLNNDFIKKLSLNYLSKSIVCKDSIKDIDNFKCDDIDASYYVKLVNVYDYVNSYLKDTDYHIWTSTILEDKIINVSNNKIMLGDYSDSYLVMPVVTLKNTTVLLSGSGSVEDPYIIDDVSDINNYYLIDNDLYASYNKDKGFIYLVSVNNKLLYKYSNDIVKFEIDNDNTLANYLNNDVYNSLSYKDILVRFPLYTGKYNGNYMSTYGDSEEVYIGVPSIVDKVIKDNNNYYLVNNDENYAYYVDNGLKLSKVNFFRNIKYTICISNKNKVSGSGSTDDPFVVEVDHE